MDLNGKKRNSLGVGVYQQLIAAGKAPKQAITAVMRKLVVLANALLKKGSPLQNKMA